MPSQDWLVSLQALSESADDAVIVKDARGHILAWNSAAEALYGYSASEVVGKPISILTPPGGWGEVLGLIHLAEEGSVTRDRRVTRRRKDGSEVLISLTVVPIIDADGELLGICTTARTVEDADPGDRFQEIRWMASIVESSEDAIIGKTPDGEIISWNAAAERLYGYPASKALGRHISMLAPPGRSDEIQPLMERIVRGERIDHFVTERVTRTGARILVSLSLSPITDSVGNVIGVSTSARRVDDEQLPVEAPT